MTLQAPTHLQKEHSEIGRGHAISFHHGNDGRAAQHLIEGRLAVLGVVDGASPLGVETDADIAWRKDLLRKIGYKL